MKTLVHRDEFLGSGVENPMLNWFILACISTEQGMAEKLADKQKLNVKLVIEGVEFDVRPLFKRLEKYRDEDARNKARMMVHVMMDDIHEQFQEFRKNLKLNPLETLGESDY